VQDSWWVYALAATAVVIFPVGLVVGIRCGLHRCSGSLVERLMSLDGLGGLPRLYTTGLFVAIAIVAWAARTRATGAGQLWWAAVSAIGGGLALAKLLSVHSVAKGAAPLATLVGGLLLTVLALVALTASGRRWRVRATIPVVGALGIYAGTALGLDLVTSLLIAVQDRVGALSRASVTFAEEFGEAVAALFVLVTVRWHLPPTSGQMPGRTTPQRQA
jgi:hypothetical protein